MTFCNAVDAVPALAGTCRPGLQALGNHAALVLAAEPTGSIDIDAALKKLQPDSNRYDYGIGLKRTVKQKRRDSVVWVEVHSATTGEVSVLISKQQALEDWLRQNAPDLLQRTTHYWWIPSKKVDIPKHMPQYRRLMQSKIRLAKTRPCEVG